MQKWQGEGIEIKVLYSRAGVGQQILINAEEGTALVDIGDGTLRELLSEGLDFTRLKGIVLTHGHFDHMGGLYSLLGYLRMKGREEKLSIFAPKGCIEVEEITKAFIRCYSDTIPFKINYRELKDYEEFEIAGMVFKAYPVVHCGSTKQGGILSQIPAMGYRIAYKNQIIAISGDTGICDSLLALVKGADLAILEATIKKGKGEVLKKVHLSEAKAREIGSLAKSFILIHQGKEVLNRLNHP